MINHFVTAPFARGNFIKEIYINNLKYRCYNMTCSRGYSSVGQSTSLTSKRSPVRTQIVPPEVHLCLADCHKQLRKLATGKIQQKGGILFWRTVK